MPELTARQKVELLVGDANNIHGATLLSCYSGEELSQSAKEALDRHGHMTVVEALTKVATLPIEDKVFFEDITTLAEVECLRVNFLYVLWPFYDAILSAKK